jgi:hypothetical protein
MSEKSKVYFIFFLNAVKLIESFHKKHTFQKFFHEYFLFLENFQNKNIIEVFQKENSHHLAVYEKYRTFVGHYTTNYKVKDEELE